MDEQTEEGLALEAESPPNDDGASETPRTPVSGDHSGSDVPIINRDNCIRLLNQTFECHSGRAFDVCVFRAEVDLRNRLSGCNTQRFFPQVLYRGFARLQERDYFSWFWVEYESRFEPSDYMLLHRTVAAGSDSYGRMFSARPYWINQSLDYQFEYPDGRHDNHGC